MKFLYDRDIGDYLIVEKCRDCPLVDPNWNQCGICQSEEEATELKLDLLLKHIKIGDTWYWECQICRRKLAPHKKEGASRMWRNFQSKGAASRHLMTHNKHLVHHGNLDMTVCCPECDKSNDKR